MTTTLPETDRLLHELLEWHFHPRTGSPFWLSVAESLDFDPVEDTRSHADLSRFPDVSELLRSSSVGDLVPRGCGPETHWNAFESGGTSGPPKFVAVADEWLDELTAWRVSTMPATEPGHTLGVLPSGPHVVNLINRKRAARLGGWFFAVDLDPRWAKRLAASGRRELMTEYVDHVVDQAARVIEAQEIRFLVTTPPMLSAMIKRDDLVDRLLRSVVRVTLGGTALDLDTVNLVRDEFFPGVEFVASYGSTSALGEAGSDPIVPGVERVRYRPFDPYVSYAVIDDNGRQVPVGTRGRIQVTHLSRYAFYPRVLERDTAVRAAGEHGLVGDVVADIAPLGTIDGSTMTEGVY